MNILCQKVTRRKVSGYLCDIIVGDVFHKLAAAVSLVKFRTLMSRHMEGNRLLGSMFDQEICDTDIFHLYLLCKLTRSPSRPARFDSDVHV